MTSFDDFDRASGIGASEVAAIVGKSPWRTPVEVWMEKVGLGAPRRETSAMRLGHSLERAILGVAAEAASLKLTHNNVTFVHPDWPDVPLFATPDGFTRRRHGLVEVKVVGHRWDDWRDGPPPYVQAQVQAQLATLPRVGYGLVVALLGSDVRTYDVPRDDEVTAAILDDVRAFWADYVQPEIAPPPVNLDDRWSLARLLSADVDGARARRDPDESEEIIGARLVAHLRMAKDLDAQIADLRVQLAERAVDADIVTDEWRAAWADRRQTDWAAIARARGATRRDIDQHTTTTRVFSFRRSRVADDTEERPT